MLKKIINANFLGGIMLNIRLSSVNDTESAYWKAQRTIIMDTLHQEGMKIINGSGDQKIHLIGKESVHSHLARYDGLVFMGDGSPAELLKCSSATVAIQTLDNHMHFFAKGEKYRKPVLLYLPEDMPDRATNRYILFAEQLGNLRNNGTISDNLDRLFRIVTTPAELIDNITQKVPGKTSIHNDIHIRPDVNTQIGTINFEEPSKNPRFKITVFTSANPNQDDFTRKEARDLGQEIAKKGFGLITGAGNTGLMYIVHEGCFDRGGWTEGVNCPHIVQFEGTPDGMSKVSIVPNIYDRMAAMFKGTDIVVLPGGGRGGGGSLQEGLATLYLILQNNGKGLNIRDYNNRELRLGKSNFCPNMPIQCIIDDRLGLWQPFIQIADSFGLKEGKDFHVVKGTKEVSTKIDVLYQEMLKNKYKNPSEHQR